MVIATIAQKDVHHVQIIHIVQVAKADGLQVVICVSWMVIQIVLMDNMNQMVLVIVALLDVIDALAIHIAHNVQADGL